MRRKRKEFPKREQAQRQHATSWEIYRLVELHAGAESSKNFLAPNKKNHQRVIKKREEYDRVHILYLLYANTIQSSSEYMERSTASTTRLAPLHKFNRTEMTVKTNIY